MLKPCEQTNHSNQPLRILRMAELTAFLGISRSSIYEKLNPKSRYYDADFPKPIRLGGRIYRLAIYFCRRVDRFPNSLIFLQKKQRIMP
ncbi:Predicted transcriptional regulator [Citrobacter koseri]|nr:Predicted transcriptional regulator [Citrobacter koseri]